MEWLGHFSESLQDQRKSGLMVGNEIISHRSRSADPVRFILMCLLFLVTVAY